MLGMVVCILLASGAIGAIVCSQGAKHGHMHFARSQGPGAQQPCYKWPGCQAGSTTVLISSMLIARTLVSASL